MGNKLLNSTLFYTLSNFLPQAVAFILIPVYSRFLSPAEYGIISSMIVIQGLLFIFFSLALDRSIVRLYWDHEDEEERKSFLGTIFLSIIFVSSFMLIVCLILQTKINMIFCDIPFYPYYFFSILTIFISNISLFPKNYFRLKNQSRNYLILTSLELVISTSFILLWLISYRQGALGVIKGKLYAFALLLPVYLYLSIRIVSFRFDLYKLKKIIQFSLPILPTLLAAWILGQVDRIFIAQNLSMGEVGIYSLSKSIASIISVFSASFMMAYQPFYFEIASSQILSDSKKQLYSYNNVYILVMIIFSFILIFLSKEIISIFIDNRYNESYKYVPMLSLAMLIGSISSTVIGACFQQSKKMKLDMYIGLSAACLSVILSYYLIMKFGINGIVATAFIISSYILITGQIIAKKECYYVKISGIELTQLSIILFVTYLFFSGVIYYLFANIYKILIIKILVLLIMLPYMSYKTYQKILVRNQSI